VTRDEFLKNHWPAYPHFPELWSAETPWVAGKIAALDGATLYLGDGQGYPAAPGARHATLGPCLPIELCRPGDCVALKKLSAGWEGPYLLSPNLLEKTPAAGRDWQDFLECVRAFFISRGFRSWLTPYLVTSSGVDAHIDFMTVQGVRTGRRYSLPTSPEFELKKVLAAGERRVFEIKSCFRDDDDSPTHRQEFTMLEWYRAYEGKWSLLDDFEGLLKALPAQNTKPIPPLRRASIAELFAEHVKMDLTPRTTEEELRRTLVARGLHSAKSDDWDDLFSRLYIECIEPHLGHDGPLAIYDFPATQSSLSRQTAEGWADRFEIYWRGVELANAYQEQNNPYLVSEVVTREINKRQTLGRIPPQADAAFLQAMKAGFPPCSGIALGLDRLYMVLRGSSRLM